MIVATVFVLIVVVAVSRALLANQRDLTRWSLGDAPQISKQRTDEEK